MKNIDNQFETFSLKQAENLGIIEKGNLGALSKDKLTYNSVTKKIIAELKKGNLVWRKPWKNGYVDKNGVVHGPHNYESKHVYSGVNAWWIGFINNSNGTNWTQFLTKQQVEELGGKLKKGAEPISVHAFIKGIAPVKDGNGKPLKNDKGEVINEKYVGFVGYNVYPLEMTEGVREIKSKIIIADDENTSVKQANEDAQAIIDQMPNAPKLYIKKGSDRAFYSPSDDSVTMPDISQFKKPAFYYSTFFHELVHSTGHKKRLNRGFELTTRFGDKNYAFEELIAELGAAYLCGTCNIDYHTLKNTAAYLKSWSGRLIEELSKNKQMFFRAISGAQAAANFILDRENKAKKTSSGSKPVAVRKIEKTKKPVVVKKTMAKVKVDNKDTYFTEAIEYLKTKPKGKVSLSLLETTYGRIKIERKLNELGKDILKTNGSPEQVAEIISKYIKNSDNKGSKQIKMSLSGVDNVVYLVENNQKMYWVINKKTHLPWIHKKFKNEGEAKTFCKQQGLKIVQDPLLKKHEFARRFLNMTNKNVKPETIQSLNRDLKEANLDIAPLNKVISILTNAIKQHNADQSSYIYLQLEPGTFKNQLEYIVKQENFGTIYKLKSKPSTKKKSTDEKTIVKKITPKSKLSPVAGIDGIDEGVIEEMMDLYEKAQVKKSGNEFVKLGKISDIDVQRIKQQTGLVLSNYKREFTFSHARHIFLEHGQQLEKYKEQKRIDSTDIALIPLILTKFDTVTLEEEKSSTGNRILKYTKKIGKKHIVCEEIIEKNKILSIKTYYIKNALNGIEGTSAKECLSKGLSLVPSSTKRPNRAISSTANIHKTHSKKQTHSLSGIFQPIASAKAKTNTFMLDGDLGKFLGNLETYKLAMTLEGDQGAGKTQFAFQLANAFAGIGKKVGFFSIEIGSESDIILRNRDKYIEPKNIARVLIAGEAREGIKTIKDATSEVDVVIIDSWTKLDVDSSEFDKLRNDHPNTIFIVIFQRTSNNTIRGGTKPLYDAGINIEVKKVDDSFVNNYAFTSKNRYGASGLKYNISKQEIINV